MIQFIKPGTNINFIGIRKTAITVSVVVIVIGLISVAIRGFNYGIDFSGGTMVQLLFKEDVHIDKVRKGLTGINMGDSTIQHYGGRKEGIVRGKGKPGTLGEIGE